MRPSLAAAIFLLVVSAIAAEAPAVDAQGDALPEHAIARIGSTRLRHGGVIDALAMSPDNRLIASRGYDKFIRVWEAKTGRLLWEFSTPQWGAYALAFSPDSKQLAMAVQTVLETARSEGTKETGSFMCWDLTTGRELERHDGFKGVGPGERV